MAVLREILDYANQLLDISSFNDYCPNGLQVEGVSDVQKIITGVTASQALLQQAVNQQANMVLVHHGFFWRGEAAAIVGLKKQKIALLVENDISLVTYHLPLDAHAKLGNNAQLAKQLGISIEGRFGAVSSVGMHGSLLTKRNGQALADHIAHTLGRVPLWFGDADKSISSVAWCTGAAQNYFDEIIPLGVDAYITGEVSEQNYHMALETGINFYAAGHHATERYGVQALGEHLAEAFMVEHQYIELPNPV